MALQADNGLSTKELAYILGICQPSLNELLSKLEQGGYIKREPSKEDKRMMMVGLTPKGKEQDFKEANQQDIFQCLDEKEEEAFNTLLDKAITNLEGEFTEEHLKAERAWVEKTRRRMGDENFDTLIKMHNRFSRRRVPLGEDMESMRRRTLSRTLWGKERH